MLRWRMLRHGAHHVNRPSFSGSTARPRSTRPRLEDPLDHRTLFRELADRARLAFLRVHVAFGARHVHVAASRQRAVRAPCNDAA